MELLIVVLLIGILAAISAPFLIAAKASANEASAIGTLRALNSAQTAFVTACGSGRYATSFNQLVTGRFAGPDMDVSPKSGFTFGLTPTGAAGAPACDGGPTQTAYYAWGQPLSNLTGSRAFATNQIYAIWQDNTGVPPVEPFTSSATVEPLGR